VRGGFKEGKSRRRFMASTQRLQGVELGGEVVGGGWVQRPCGRVQVTWEEGDDRWGPPVS
jgi:hypothetical protein